MLERNMTSSLAFHSLSDDQLLSEVQRLATRERHTTAKLLRALMEVDSRRLYLREGCSSLFTYCTQVLHLEESAAYNRIETARAARRLPALLDAIGDGSLTLSSARLLAPHLTLDNHAQLLQAAQHRSKREVEALVAHLAPKPAVATLLRKIASPPFADMSRRAVTTAPVPATATATAITAAATPVAPLEPPVQPQQRDVDARQPHSRSSVAPLSADAYKLQVTISAA